MKKRFLSLFLALALCLGLAAPAFAANAGSPLAENPSTLAVNGADAQQIYQAMVALKKDYPEGTPWTNDNYYRWKGGIYSGGYGCVGFAFMLSDAAFGDLPARTLTEFAFSDVRVGDILRINNDTHSVVVLEVHDDHVVIAEGNFNSSVHWGRTLSAGTVTSAAYLMTRYPVEIPPASFDDVPDWCSKAVDWAVYTEITNGTGDNKFSPNDTCTNAMILTFLWRAAGKPQPAYQSPIPMRGNEYYADAVHWAYTYGMIGRDFDPKASCTRLSALTYIWRAVDSRWHTGVTFTDITSANTAQDGMSAVAWAVQEGVTNGYTDGTFRPGKVCTRGEIVTFLHRAYVEDARLAAK